MRHIPGSPYFWMNAVDCTYSAFVVCPFSWHLHDCVEKLSYDELKTLGDIPFPPRRVPDAPTHETIKRIWLYLHIGARYQLLGDGFLKSVFNLNNLDICKCTRSKIRALEVPNATRMLCMACGNPIMKYKPKQIKTLAAKGRRIGNQGKRQDFPDNYLQYDALKRARNERLLREQNESITKMMKEKYDS